MKYLLDSDTITAVFDPKSIFFEIAKKHLNQLTEMDEIYISILSIYELEYSLYNAKNDIVKNNCILVAKDGIYNDHLALINKQLNIEDWTIEVN